MNDGENKTQKLFSPGELLPAKNKTYATNGRKIFGNETRKLKSYGSVVGVKGRGKSIKCCVQATLNRINIEGVY
ncbi:hypothetical protein DCC62_17285 [candidate division KSB1 bacterium]|nr:MAG: hypothetical protein DCC62_17285 [candidate division KSB1 bacterium]